MDASTPGLVDDVLTQGHAWLRFPPQLEVQFRADTLEPRRKLLMACGLLAMFGVIIGSINLRQLSPDIVDQVEPILGGILLSILLSLVVTWFIPKKWRRSWQIEALTTANALSLVAMLIWMGTASRVDTTFTHLATIASVVTYVCIAARQRFVWSFSCAALSFVGCVMLVPGHTPAQALLMSGHVNLMVLTFALALIANYAFEHNERRTWLLRKQQQHQRAVLHEASEQLRRLSIEDGLTGLFNRRQFDADLALAWSTAKAAGQPLAILLLDVDHFKRYNDTYGHQAGDTCLIRVSQALREVSAFLGGTAARLGGEEFGVILPNHTKAQALLAAEALCDGVRSAGIPHSTSSVSGVVTASVGVAQAWPGQGGHPQGLVEAADRGLYQAKNLGRNRACAADLNQTDAVQVAPSEGLEPAQPPLPPEPEALQAPAQAYAQVLQGKFRWLHFPARLEAAYQEHNALQRRNHLAVMALVGLVVYNVYVYNSRPMFPDVQSDVLMAQFALSALMLLLAVGSFSLKLSYHWREGLFSLSTALIALVSTWVLSHSQLLSALSCALCLVLIPMFSGVAAQQPFWFTCGPAVITPLAFGCLFNPVGEVQSLVFVDNIFIIVNSTIYTLILAYALEYGARKDWLLSQIEREQGEALELATRRLHELSVLDPLTGISNRRQFEDEFQRIWGESQHQQRPLALLIIDVDHFKRYNDGYGHPAGDRCLRQVAAAIEQTAQASQGLAARLGGEEFGILLPGAPAEQALQVAQQVCEAVRLIGIEHRYTPTAAHVTVSVGAASLRPDAGSHQRMLFSIADEALYRAKNAGRNQTATATA